MCKLSCLDPSETVPSDLSPCCQRETVHHVEEMSCHLFNRSLSPNFVLQDQLPIRRQDYGTSPD